MLSWFGSYSDSERRFNMSTSRIFTSNFGEQIQKMLSFRASIGYSSETYASELKNFDQFCIQHCPFETHLTKALALKWSEKREHENVNGHRTRLLALRQFGKYLNLCGHQAYIIPMEFISKPEVYTPYLFTNEELIRFFAIIDRISPLEHSDFSDYTLPVFFRIAYGCGLRPNELFNLRCRDIHFKEQHIFVYYSKTKRDRIVPLSDDLIDLCKKYDAITRQKFPDRDWFFHVNSELKHRKKWFAYRLKKYWKDAGLFERLGKYPRIYDFRHNFATRILMKWFDEGEDVMAMMPYLSTYMGHVQLHNTMYYIHLLPEYIRNNKSFDWSQFEALLPEVPHE